MTLSAQIAAFFETNPHAMGDPLAVAKMLGVRVLEAEQTPRAVLDARAVPVNITLSTALRPIQRRYALAHALAHLVLGHGPLVEDHAVDHTFDAADARQKAALTWAIAFLVPERPLRVLIYGRGVTDVTALAEAFAVGDFLMYHRLRQLGIV